MSVSYSQIEPQRNIDHSSLTLTPLLDLPTPTRRQSLLLFTSHLVVVTTWKSQILYHVFFDHLHIVVGFSPCRWISPGQQKDIRVEAAGCFLNIPTTFLLPNDYLENSNDSMKEKTMPRLLEAASPAPLVLHQESPSPSGGQSSSALYFFLGGLIVLLILLILLFVFRKFIRPSHLKKLVKRKDSNKAAKDYFSGSFRTISYFSFHALKKATKNFHESNLLGKGGFGPVYLGKLEDGLLVAIKKLAIDDSQQGEAEFLSEVKMITSIQHKNLVRLLGCCSQGPQRLLVYEYMKNKSLDHIIYGKSDQYLNWDTRFQIILGIARGLQYLHEDSHLRIVHRDIKASNILLDDKFHPRIGDFGLARFFPEDQAYLSTTFAGTLGYTAPEYAIRGELSEKADIYSFGVLVLEIISCRKNTDLALRSDMQYLPEYAWKLYERSRMIDLVDPRLRNAGFIEKDVMQTIHVALLCLQGHANTRPPMSEVVAMLTWKVEMVKSPSKPTFLDRRNRWKNDQKTSWETISADFPSNLESESPSLTPPPNSRDFNANESFSGPIVKL